MAERTVLKVVEGKQNNYGEETSADCLWIWRIHDFTNCKYHDLDENQLDCRCSNATLEISAVLVLLPSNTKKKVLVSSKAQTKEWCVVQPARADTELYARWNDGSVWSVNQCR